jgi:selenide,water dikinase
VPWLPGVEELAASGYVTGASNRNWAGYGHHVNLHNVSAVQKALLTDPQTSGGLLVACAPGAANDVLAVFRADGFDRAAVIGSLEKGTGISVI